ncbi:MAG: FemAB family XrtA/PEP-CTERM system-associated protein [Gemmataceae bacterium]
MTVAVRIYRDQELWPRLAAWQPLCRDLPHSRRPGWLRVLASGLQHQAIGLEAQRQHELCGILPLAYVQSLLFGRFLVGLPYLNYGGVLADAEDVARALIDRAIELADELEVRFLELRHETAATHSRLATREQGKVQMRLPLPSSADELWTALDAKVRNQVRKAEKQGLTTDWGRAELLPDFYDVFSRRMRELGTPVYSRQLFTSILDEFPDDAEFAVVRAGNTALAAALVLHGPTMTEAPSAASRRERQDSNANMFLYWQLLRRAIERGQRTFDFGRSDPDSGTYRFKGQWGAVPAPTAWQYYLRKGSMEDMRPGNAKFSLAVKMWRKLPLPVTRWLGPWIVRGIP